MSIPITRSTQPKPQPNPAQLGFGKYFTDHMFVMENDVEKGWLPGQIVPYAPITLDPAAMVLHYGQEVFEGLKAYRRPDGRAQLFRPQDNIKRFNRSCVRLSVPEIDQEYFLNAMKQLVITDIDWLPSQPEASLYIRPYLVASDPFLGVRRSERYIFIIILSPVGAYYPGGITPTKILIEGEDVRAASGGLGSVKAGANYAATLRAQTRASQKGFAQVMWLDSHERKYVEEVGTSNAFFVIDDKVVTPSLTDTILPGITRDSCIQLLRKWGLEVQERAVSIDEVWETHENGKLSECFATGTAAVVSPVGELFYRDKSIKIGNNEVGPVARRLYDALTDIQWGRKPDDMGWTITL
ncbi:MAG: branched-chain amino acid aminotransferase [Oscillospiraceae bacterium]|nr:branched-chain amino acid aminotransferase [Oscillospiraceae bacterium]